MVKYTEHLNFLLCDLACHRFESALARWSQMHSSQVPAPKCKLIPEWFSYTSYGCELLWATGMRQLLRVSVQMLDGSSNFCLLEHHLAFGNV